MLFMLQTCFRSDIPIHNTLTTTFVKECLAILMGFRILEYILQYFFGYVFMFLGYFFL